MLNLWKIQKAALHLAGAHRLEPESAIAELPSYAIPGVTWPNADQYFWVYGFEFFDESVLDMIRAELCTEVAEEKAAWTMGFLGGPHVGLSGEEGVAEAIRLLDAEFVEYNVPWRVRRYARATCMYDVTVSAHSEVEHEGSTLVVELFSFEMFGLLDL